jgi:hypothetical protein
MKLHTQNLFGWPRWISWYFFPPKGPWIPSWARISLAESTWTAVFVRLPNMQCSTITYIAAVKVDQKNNHQSHSDASTKSRKLAETLQYRLVITSQGFAPAPSHSQQLAVLKHALSAWRTRIHKAETAVAIKPVQPFQVPDFPVLGPDIRVPRRPEPGGSRRYRTYLRLYHGHGWRRSLEAGRAAASRPVDATLRRPAAISRVVVYAALLLSLRHIPKPRRVDVDLVRNNAAGKKS